MNCISTTGRSPMWAALAAARRRGAWTAFLVANTLDGDSHDVADHVVDYAVRLVRKTRPGSPDAPEDITRMLNWGAGPRASQCLILGAKARAVLEGRIHVSCNDIRRAAVPVLRHRIITSYEAEAENINSDHIIRRILDHTDVP